MEKRRKVEENLLATTKYCGEALEDKNEGSRCTSKEIEELFGKGLDTKCGNGLRTDLTSAGPKGKLQ